MPTRRDSGSGRAVATLAVVAVAAVIALAGNRAVAADAAAALLVALLFALAWIRIRRDVTALRAVEQELRASEARFRGLVRDVPVGVLVQDPQARFILANPKALELLGLTEDQMLGRTSYDPAWNVVDEAGRVLAAAEYPVNRAIATRAPVRDAVIGVQRAAAGDRIWLLLNADPEVGEDGALVEVLCTFHVISFIECPPA